MPDKDRPSTWIKFKSGMCDNCFAGCCTMPVEVTSADLVRLDLADAADIELQPKKTAKRLIKLGQVKSYRAATGLFMLEQKSNGDCLFLDENRRCTVYTKRPGVCREFPNIGPRPGYCPTQKIR